MDFYANFIFSALIIILIKWNPFNFETLRRPFKVSVEPKMILEMKENPSAESVMRMNYDDA